MNNLQKAAKLAVCEAVRIKPNERVLILTCPIKEREAIARAIYEETRKITKNAILIYQEGRKSGETRDCLVNEIIKANPDVIISISMDVAGRDPELFSKPIKYKGRTFTDIIDLFKEKKAIRGFGIGGNDVNPKDFARCVLIDWKKLQRTGNKLLNKVTRAKKLILETPYNTRLEVPLSGRKAFSGMGDLHRMGCVGNFPTGEVFVSPIVGQTNGTYAFDGSINTSDGLLVPKQPIIIYVKDGFIYEISGGPAAKKLKYLLQQTVVKIDTMVNAKKLPANLAEEYKRNVYGIGEIGLGLNPAAKVRGVGALEDETTYGTAHVAIGQNYDNDQPTIIHWDATTKKPTVTLEYSKNKQEIVVQDNKVL